MPTEVEQDTSKQGKRHARIDDAILAMKVDLLFAVWPATGTFGLIAAVAETLVVLMNSLRLAVFIALLLSLYWLLDHVLVDLPVLRLLVHFFTMARAMASQVSRFGVNDDVDGVLDI